MTATLPLWASALTSLLVLLGAGLILTGTIGLLRLDTFYARVHPPTLGSTLGIGCILLASMLCFSMMDARPVVHELLIAFFVTITTPVTLMLLVRAALSRDWTEGADRVPPKPEVESDGKSP